MKPRVAFRVDNKLADDDTKLAVELIFESLDGFGPEKVVEQIEPLRKLVEARERLSGLLTSMDGNDRLDDILQEVVQNTEALKSVNEDIQKKRESNSATEAEGTTPRKKLNDN